MAFYTFIFWCHTLKPDLASSRENLASTLEEVYCYLLEDIVQSVQNKIALIVYCNRRTLIRFSWHKEKLVLSKTEL